MGGESVSAYLLSSFGRTMASEQNCTLLINPQGSLATAAELQADLESPEVPRKITGLKKAIFLLLSGEDMPRALMTVIRFCITVEDHTLQVHLF